MLFLSINRDGYGQKAFAFQLCHFQNGGLVSNPNFNSTSLVRPYWIFSFRTLTLVWLWISKSKFQWHITCVYGKDPVYPFQMSWPCCSWSWPEVRGFLEISLSKYSPDGHIGFFGFLALASVWLWIISPNFKWPLGSYIWILFPNSSFGLAPNI